jgi:LacI family transcriptional regulator
VELGQSLAQKIDALPTAFFCADDMIALGLVDGLLESGIDVPGQISACTSTMVIWPDVIARGQYTLSGISVPWEVIGNVAVQRLLAQKTPGTGIGRHTVTGSWLAGTTVGPASAART